MKLTTTIAAFGTAALACTALAASAATMTTTDRDAFQSGLDLTVETFDTDMASALSLTFAGGITASKTSTGGSFGATTGNRVTNGEYVGFVQSGGARDNIFDLTAPVTAFGADFRDTQDTIALFGVGGLFASIETSAGLQTFDVRDGFFGILSDEAFSRVIFSTEKTNSPPFGNNYKLDNLTTGTAPSVAPVPLPASLPLLLAAFGGVAALRRRKAG